tara:strand:- start:1196 stop:1354 length:159 start_codon:yes stop_codon:yes gene_type:complete
MISKDKAEAYANRIAWLYDEESNPHFGVPRDSDEKPYEAKEWTERYKAERYP